MCQFVKVNTKFIEEKKKTTTSFARHQNEKEHTHDKNMKIFGRHFPLRRISITIIQAYGRRYVSTIRRPFGGFSLLPLSNHNVVLVSSLVSLVKQKQNLSEKKFPSCFHCTNTLTRCICYTYPRASVGWLFFVRCLSATV